MASPGQACHHDKSLSWTTGARGWQGAAAASGLVSALRPESQATATETVQRKRASSFRTKFSFGLLTKSLSTHLLVPRTARRRAERSRLSLSREEVTKAKEVR